MTGWEFCYGESFRGKSAEDFVVAILNPTIDVYVPSFAGWSVCTSEFYGYLPFNLTVKDVISEDGTVNFRYFVCRLVIWPIEII